MGKRIMNDLTEFSEWILVKMRLHKNGAMPSICEGEIWWAAVGKNVGVEINGKNEKFSRPVLVLRKLNKHSFLAIPLTTKHHRGSWYVNIKFRNKTIRAVLVQMRIMSVYRLYERMGALPSAELKKVQQGFNKLYCKKI